MKSLDLGENSYSIGATQVLNIGKNFALNCQSFVEKKILSRSLSPPSSRLSYSIIAFSYSYCKWSVHLGSPRGAPRSCYLLLLHQHHYAAQNVSALQSARDAKPGKVHNRAVSVRRRTVPVGCTYPAR